MRFFGGGADGGEGARGEGRLVEGGGRGRKVARMRGFFEGAPGSCSAKVVVSFCFGFAEGEQKRTHQMSLPTQASQHPLQEASTLPAFFAMRIVGDGAEGDELGEGVEHLAWNRSSEGAREGGGRRQREEKEGVSAAAPTPLGSTLNSFDAHSSRTHLGTPY